MTLKLFVGIFQRQDISKYDSDSHVKADLMYPAAEAESTVVYKELLFVDENYFFYDTSNSRTDL